MDKRSLFYWSKEYTMGIESGQDYRELPGVIAINILNFEYIQAGGFQTSFHLWEDGEKDYMLTDALELHFIDMVKYRRLPDKDILNNPLHRWLTYFDCRSPDYLVEEIIEMDSEIQRTQKIMELVARDKDMCHAYTLYQMTLMDEASVRNHAREEGLEEGRNEGRAAGREEGREEGRTVALLELAGKLKARGIPLDQIAEDTGLSPEEIKQV